MGHTAAIFLTATSGKYSKDWKANPSKKGWRYICRIGMSGWDDNRGQTVVVMVVIVVAREEDEVGGGGGGREAGPVRLS